MMITWVPCGGASFNQKPLEVPDTGSAIVSYDKLFGGPPQAGGECLYIHFNRTAIGTVDAALHADSTVTARYQDFIKVTYGP